MTLKANAALLIRSRKNNGSYGRNTPTSRKFRVKISRAHVPMSTQSGDHPMMRLYRGRLSIEMLDQRILLTGSNATDTVEVEHFRRRTTSK